MNINNYKKYFFIGIAGTGMSAIAQYMKGTGFRVAGSDRLFCPGKKMQIQEQFEKLGISCYSQDGSGITPDTQLVVVSTAIEENNIEYRKAKELGIPVMKRSELLAAISKETRTIAVGGTSGKSTTTAMIFQYNAGKRLFPLTDDRCRFDLVAETGTSRKCLGWEKRLAGH